MNTSNSIWSKYIYDTHSLLPVFILFNQEMYDIYIFLKFRSPVYGVFTNQFCKHIFFLLNRRFADHLALIWHR